MLYWCCCKISRPYCYLISECSVMSQLGNCIPNPEAGRNQKWVFIWTGDFQTRACTDLEHMPYLGDFPINRYMNLYSSWSALVAPTANMESRYAHRTTTPIRAKCFHRASSHKAILLQILIQTIEAKNMERASARESCSIYQCSKETDKAQIW